MTTITGNVKTLIGTAPGAHTVVRFLLRGALGFQPRVHGVAILAPSGGASYFVDLPADADGEVSGEVYATRDAAGTGDGEIDVNGSKQSVWYGVRVVVNGRPGPEVAIHARDGETLDISNLTPITAPQPPIAPTSDSVQTGLITFDRAPAAPFAVTDGSGVVENLVADHALTADDAALLEGEDASFYKNAGNLNAGTLPVGRLAAGTFSTVVVDDTGDVTIPAQSGNTLVIMENASLATIRGIEGGVDGQIVRILSHGAGNVFLAHNHSTPDAAHRLHNFVKVGPTPLAAGVGVAEYQYAGAHNHWHLVSHSQGAPITRAYDADNYTAIGVGSVTIESGDVALETYSIVGNTLTARLTYASFTTASTVDEVRSALPFGWTMATGLNVLAPSYADNNGSVAVGALYAASVLTALRLFPTIALGGWSAGSNTHSFIGTLTVQLA